MGIAKQPSAEGADVMTDAELRAVVDSLAKTAAITRAEIDVLRVLTFAATAVIAGQPNLLDNFVDAMQANLDREEAISNASPMTDEFLAQLVALWERYIPGQALQRLRLPGQSE
jgi:hypothetical protein